MATIWSRSRRPSTTKGLFGNLDRNRFNDRMAARTGRWSRRSAGGMRKKSAGMDFTVAWASRGDCPLQSGASYFLNIVPASGDLGGWAPYVDRDQSYAGGSGYASSAAQDWDMGVTLEMEGDDLLTELAVISGGCEGWSSTFSQVFQARGTALRTAGFWVGGISDRSVGKGREQLGAEAVGRLERLVGPSLDRQRHG